MHIIEDKAEELLLSIKDGLHVFGHKATVLLVHAVSIVALGIVSLKLRARFKRFD